MLIRIPSSHFGRRRDVDQPAMTR